jgi:flagellar biosynthesis protein FlhA
VLVHGHEGGAAAGHVIEAFGEFLIGGNFAVGLFVFMILMIINLVVITKGAGRVSEVSARFTLDALPGKQMAIDADLAAGLMTAEEAKARRREIATEADFYGSMDGASKFVKGDAVAALLILGVNIIAGFCLGMISHGLTASNQPAVILPWPWATLWWRRCQRCCCPSPPPSSSPASMMRAIWPDRSAASLPMPAHGCRWR